MMSIKEDMTEKSLTSFNKYILSIIRRIATVSYLPTIVLCVKLVDAEFNPYTYPHKLYNVHNYLVTFQ